MNETHSASKFGPYALVAALLLAAIVAWPAPQTVRRAYAKASDGAGRCTQQLLWRAGGYAR